MPLGMGPTVLGLFAAGFGVGALLVLVPRPSVGRVAKYEANGSAPSDGMSRAAEELRTPVAYLEESANMGKPDATHNAPKLKAKGKRKAKARKGAEGASADPASDDDLDLRKLDRVQLLQLLRDAMEENERLRTQLDETTERAEQAERKLEDRRIQVEDSESLAEASLRLAGVFVDAQRAIDLYGYNVAMNKVSGDPSSGPRHLCQDGRDHQSSQHDPSGLTGEPERLAPDLSAEATQVPTDAMQAERQSLGASPLAGALEDLASNEGGDLR